MSTSRQIYLRWGKRALDLAAATIGLILLSPLMMVCAILVRLTSPGPIFFRQLRPGLHARPFKVFKFRTMCEGAEKSGASIVIHKDSRLTPVGAMLRALKLDEIPQLINILVGDMSFVGPRPRPPENIVNVDQYEQSRLFSVRPGITSYATIYHHNEEEYCNQQNDPVAAYRELQSQKSQLDEEYLENVSLWVDLKLILLTLLLLFPGTSSPTNSRLRPLKNHHSERAVRMAADSAIFAACVWVAYWLRFDGQLIDFQEPQRNLFMILLPLIQIISYRMAGVYDMVWRYVNRVDFSVLAAASAIVSAIFLIIRLTILPGAGFPHILSLPLGVIVLDHLLALASTISVRAFRRSLYELGDYYQPWPPRKPRRILILGAGRTGLETALAIKRLPHMEVVGFLDDDPAKDGCLIGGCRVVGNSNALREVIHDRAVSDLFICVRSIANFEMRKISESCRCCGVHTHLVTTVNHLLGVEQFDRARVLMDSQAVGEL